MESPENERGHEHGEQTRPADLPPDLAVKNEGAAPERDHQILCEEDKSCADAAEDTMHFPAPAIKQGLESVHDGGEHRVEKYRPSEGDFNMAVEQLHAHRVPEKTRDEGERQHERKRQRHGPVKNDHWHDVNMGVVHPIERGEEDLDDLGEKDERHEDKEENHRGKSEIRISKSETISKALILKTRCLTNAKVLLI